MTDPLSTLDIENNHLKYSDTNATTDLNFPAISISSVPDGRSSGAHAGATTAESSNGVKLVPGHGPGLRATNHPNNNDRTSAYTAYLDPDARPAVTTNPLQETRPDLYSSVSGLPIVKIHDTGSEHQLASFSAGVTSNSGYTLSGSSFGSQPWVGASTPVLEFAPQPLYEPTGELIHENIDTFAEFDAPSITNLPVSTYPTLASPTSRLANKSSVTNGTGSTIAAVSTQVPRSVLKRRTSSNLETFTKTSVDKKVRRPGGSVTDSGIETPQANNRIVTFERMSGLGPTSPDDDSTPSELPTGTRTGPGVTAGNRRARQSSGSTPRPPILASNSSHSSNRQRGTRTSSAHPPSILPPEKVFPIQIGSDLFRLSGASISSDAPSYFTQFFEEQIRQNEESGGVRTLYIDRDPATFRDVARHLQGYYVKPTDGSHFVKLFADAQFYSLPRLIDQLFESEIFIQIGERHFQIPKDIFSEPGNSPNFFSLGFAVFFSTPGEVFPGLDRRGLLRPPSITPPYVPGRSAEIFAELLHLLRGYPLHIRNESHRSELLRDCRYFHLRGLEQKIIAHEISYNSERQKQEICLRLEDVKPSGVAYSSNNTMGEKTTTGGWVYYARPFVDDTSYEMVLEIGSESTMLDLTDMRADFHGLAKARVSSLFQVVANKMNLPTNAPLGLMMLSGGRASQSASPGHTPLSEDRVKVRFEAATDIRLDDATFDIDWSSSLGQVLQHGPSSAPSDSESDSDVMSEDTPARAGPSQQRSQLSQITARGSGAVPPIHTSRLSAPSAKKRKRQNSQGELGDWIIRTGQWRLRVQPCSQDTIRGGFEIVFIGVKIDAYSCEKARNARRGFLT